MYDSLAPLQTLRWQKDRGRHGITFTRKHQGKSDTQKYVNLQTWLEFNNES